jgi:hypothetical protein
LWKEVIDLCNPTRAFYAPTDQDKAKKPATVFNSRGIHACNIASSGFLSYTANRQSAWYRLRTSDLKLMEEPGVADFLEQADGILYAEFERNGFYECLGEMTPDGHSIGTAYGYIEEDIARRRILFQGRHYLSAWIEENAFGEVDVLTEEVLMSYRDLVNRFNDELTETIRSRAKTEPYSTRAVKHKVMPMDTRFLAFAKKRVDPRMPYVSIWYDEELAKILDVGGYWEFPFLVSRFRKNSGEAYGRSPGQDSLGDLYGATQMTKSRLRLGQIIADPTILADAKLEGSDDILPGGRIYVKGQQRFEPVTLGANYPITIDNEERQDHIIDDHFMVPIYLMLQQMEGKMTAREVIERVGEKAAVLGYITGRFHKEVLQPAIRRTFNLLLRAGRLPELPPALIEAKNEAGLQIEFMGFFAQVQKKYYAMNGINTAIDYSQAMREIFGPEVLDVVSGDDLFREALDASGAPQKAIREKIDIQKIRTARAQAIEAARQQQMQQQGAQAIMQNMDKLGRKPEEGSPLEQMDAMTPGPAKIAAPGVPA